MGSKNNLVTVKMSDFEVFQALAKDSEGIHSSAQTEYSQVNVVKYIYYLLNLENLIKKIKLYNKIIIMFSGHTTIKALGKSFRAPNITTSSLTSYFK